MTKITVVSAAMRSLFQAGWCKSRLKVRKHNAKVVYVDSWLINTHDIHFSSVVLEILQIAAAVLTQLLCREVGNIALEADPKNGGKMIPDELQSDPWSRAIRSLSVEC